MRSGDDPALAGFQDCARDSECLQSRQVLFLRREAEVGRLQLSDRRLIKTKVSDTDREGLVTCFWLGTNESIRIMAGLRQDYGAKEL